MSRPSDQKILAPCKSPRTLKTPVQLKLPRNLKTHAAPVPPKSPRNLETQLNQNANDEDHESEDENKYNESNFIIIIG